MTTIFLTQSDEVNATPIAPVVDGGEDAVVICIDPGHGGENLGGEYEDYTEKELTLKTAQAMIDELSQYEGITVYTTRTDDSELDLAERVDIATAVHSDFFFCLHYNMSAEHTLYGAENWISAFGKCFARGKDFAQIEMDALTEVGLFDRGIKTRLGQKGTDYYGVIKRSTEAGMPSVIIEHCHLDHPNDSPFIDQDNWPFFYGRLDATSVAKYYGLKKKDGSVDYSDYSYVPTEIPSKKMSPDLTEPDYCMAKLLSIDPESLIAEIEVSSYDYDSRMLYYTWSFDGGNTFAQLQPWPDQSLDSFTFSVKLPQNQKVNLQICTHNLHDLKAYSEPIAIAAIEGTKVDTTSDEKVVEQGDGSGSPFESEEANATLNHDSNDNILNDQSADNDLTADQSISEDLLRSSVTTFLLAAVLVLLGLTSIVCLITGVKYFRSGRR